MKNNKLKHGFTLLLSILVVSVILSVGLGIFDIMTKGAQAFRAWPGVADRFLRRRRRHRMFFYWEIKHPDLVGTAFSYYDSNPPTIKCAGNSFSIPAQSNGPYNLNINLSNNSCAKVKVTKSGLITTVESRGYNMACGLDSSFKVERAIQLTATKQQGT